MNDKKDKKGGISILGLLVLGIVIVLIFSYFKINVKTVLQSPDGKNNVNYVTEAGKNIWDNYLREPTTYLWNNFVNIFWNSFLDTMTGKGTIFQKLAPTVPFGNTNNSSSSTIP